MTDRLSDERLWRLHYWARNLGTAEGYAAADAISELLGLRTKLDAGSVMRETWSLLDTRRNNPDE